MEVKIHKAPRAEDPGKPFKIVDLPVTPARAVFYAPSSYGVIASGAVFVGQGDPPIKESMTAVPLDQTVNVPFTATEPNKGAVGVVINKESTVLLINGLSTGTHPIFSPTKSADSTDTKPSEGDKTSSGQNDKTITPPPPDPTAPSDPTAPPTGDFASSTSTPLIAPEPGASKNGISGGAVAGIAVGALIVGGLIVGLAALCWFRRSRKHGARSDREASSIALMHVGEKGPVTTAQSLSSGTPTAVDTGSPQPLEDKAIAGGISGISLLIKNHVQSFYHSNRVSPGLLDLDDLQALGRDLPMSTGTLSTLLGNADTREIALRFCIAWVIISRIQLSSAQDKTLLPPEVAECFQAMALNDRSNRGQGLMLGKWRVITAELIRSTYAPDSFSASDPRNPNIEKAMQDLDRILMGYADSRMNSRERVQNLREILKRSANFAFTLFSQSSTWEFDWHEQEGLQSGSLCIFPALVQVTDEFGEPIRPPRALSDATVRPLGE